MVKMKRKTCAGAPVARHVMMTPPFLIERRRTVSNPRAAIADLCATARLPFIFIHAAPQHDCVKDRRSALAFKHKLCNLPATYAQRIACERKPLCGSCSSGTACYALYSVHAINSTCRCNPAPSIDADIGHIAGIARAALTCHAFTLAHAPSYNAN
ncbi:hypothetical protein [Paraburkholderia fungorum]|uniref:hypothetical protein n=1 Tax=Paraburkholderia fungorum TaxID=134537 RepID=UPI0038779F5B